MARCRPRPAAGGSFVELLGGSWRLPERGRGVAAAVVGGAPGVSCCRFLDGPFTGREPRRSPRSQQRSCEHTLRTLGGGMCRDWRSRLGACGGWGGGGGPGLPLPGVPCCGVGREEVFGPMVGGRTRDPGFEPAKDEDLESLEVLGHWSQGHGSQESGRGCRRTVVPSEAARGSCGTGRRTGLGPRGFGRSRDSQQENRLCSGTCLDLGWRFSVPPRASVAGQVVAHGAAPAPGPPQQPEGGPASWSRGPRGTCSWARPCPGLSRSGKLWGEVPRRAGRAGAASPGATPALMLPGTRRDGGQPGSHPAGP